MKKNSIIFCTFAALAMLFAGCKGGGGGDSKDSTTTTVSAEGAWINEADDGSGFFVGVYLKDGKVYAAATKDKLTIYYMNDAASASGTYTASGNSITLTDATTGKSETITINEGKITYGGDTFTKFDSAKIEGKSATDFSLLVFSWMTTPPSP